LTAAHLAAVNSTYNYTLVSQPEVSAVAAAAAVELHASPREQYL
jgi:hypothetical protein